MSNCTVESKFSFHSKQGMPSSKTDQFSSREFEDII